MKTHRLRGTLAVVALIVPLSLAAVLGRLTRNQADDKPAGGGPAQPVVVPKAEALKSYYYYGPNGLAEKWREDGLLAEAQRLGRDTWIHWTWGNQKVIRKATVVAGHLPVPVSIDFFRLLDSRKRGTRFRDLGLINEPNCEMSTEPDEYGLYLDKWKGDPLGYYPMSEYDRGKYPESYFTTKAKYKKVPYTLRYTRFDPNDPKKHLLRTDAAKKGIPADLRHYGRPTGIVGLRLFDNPRFEKAKWDLSEYFKNPGKVEPPYLVGFTCAFCHIAFEPNNPPEDPENPLWSNLAANIGNQYFREGELMLGQGRIAFGDKNPDPQAPGDPYRTRGLGEQDFLYHYAVTQQPGTSETSRISYDFINNPNTMNPIYGFKYRPKFKETTAWDKKPRTREVMHILKDGADSIGVEWALMRVPINIGCEGDYWVDRLFRPGKDQRPVRIAELLGGMKDKDDRAAIEKSVGLKLSDVPTARIAELNRRYRSPYGKEDFGHDWQEAWRRIPALTAYLVSYEASRLEDAPQPAKPKGAPANGAQRLRDEESRQRGAKVFGEHCAHCHSSKRPAEGSTPEEQQKFFVKSATSTAFRHGNFLADEERVSITKVDPLSKRKLGTNMARALATNAVDHDVWAEFSSKEYKALESIAPVTPLILHVPVFDPRNPRIPWALRQPIPVEFDPPGGGRGYYRTPSLISMWATAPYLHNNAVGDYRVIKERDEKGQPIKPTKAWHPNDGSRIGQKLPDGTWEDYRIDVSVEGRLKMFEDGMDKLLNPARRRNWVKRTSTDSTLIPDLAASFRQLIGSLASDVLRRQLRVWLQENQFPPAQIERVVRVVDASIDRTVREVLKDGEASARLAWAGLYLRTRDHADRLFQLLFDDVRGAAEFKVDHLPLDRLKLSLRREFLERLDRLDRDLREAALLKIPAGTPVNLYANLHIDKLPYVILAHVHHRHDPRALAQALLEMNTCPDLVEDSGHTYGAELSEEKKKDLIEFLKTL